MLVTFSESRSALHVLDVDGIKVKQNNQSFLYYLKYLSDQVNPLMKAILLKESQPTLFALLVANIDSFLI